MINNFSLGEQMQNMKQLWHWLIVSARPKWFSETSGNQ